eukprot:c13157_g1_i1 orf=65-307(+)
MASSSPAPSSSSDRGNQHTRKPKTPPFKFLVPLVYAPVLPLIRIGLRHKPVVRDRVFAVVLGVALMHGIYLVYPKLNLTH